MVPEPGLGLNKISQNSCKIVRFPKGFLWDFFHDGGDLEIQIPTAFQVRKGPRSGPRVVNSALKRRLSLIGETHMRETNAQSPINPVVYGDLLESLFAIRHRKYQNTWAFSES